MRIAGVTVGRRKIAAAVLAAVSLTSLAVITVVVGTGWGLVLLAVMLGVALLSAGLVHVEGRRDRAAQHGRNLLIAKSIAESAKTLAGTAETAAGLELATRPALGDHDVAVAHRSELLQLRRSIEELATAAHHRIMAVESAQREARAALAYVRADQARRGQGASARRASLERECDLIREAGFFDHNWYRMQTGPIDGDPVRHHVRQGASLGLSPHPLFAVVWYLDQHPDALERWRTPLAHFLECGHDPHPAFWSGWYADRYLAGGCRPELPVTHFLREGADAGFDPNPLFDVRWYREKYGHVTGPDVNPLVHYLTVGAGMDLDPSPAFSTADVRRRLGVSERDPLTTFLIIGRQRGLAALAQGITSSDSRQPHEDDRRWEYLARGLYREPDTFAVYRIIGNDLPPRHREGQSLDNLRFILEHEPPLPGCEKRWVVNRIVDMEVEKQIISLLDAHGVAYLHIPFHQEDYRKAQWRFASLPLPGFTYRREFERLGPDRRRRAVDHVYHDKNQYVMNNNGARNAALRQGRQLAKWVLPWDGNCFLTRRAWDQLVESVRSRPHL